MLMNRTSRRRNCNEMNVGTQTLRLATLSLGVSDIEISERFYRDILGLPTERRGEDVEVRWDSMMLVLTSRPPAARAKFQIAFQVDSAAEVDAWAVRLRGGGVEIMSGPMDERAQRKLYFIDPDNYELAIYSER